MRQTYFLFLSLIIIACADQTPETNSVEITTEESEPAHVENHNGLFDAMEREMKDGGETSQFEKEELMVSELEGGWKQIKVWKTQQFNYTNGKAFTLRDATLSVNTSLGKAALEGIIESQMEGEDCRIEILLYSSDGMVIGSFVSDPFYLQCRKNAQNLTGGVELKVRLENFGGNYWTQHYHTGARECPGGRR